MFFLQETLGDLGTQDFCFTNEFPRDAYGYALKAGKPLGPEDYPSNPWDLKLHLAEEHPGLMFPSFIGNTNCFLIVHQEILEFMKQFNLGKFQVFPFTLMNHKNRVHSKDYVFLNPLNVLDCLHQELSEFKFYRDGSLMKVKKYVLDENKIQEVPDLFRPQEGRREYIYSERLARALIEEKEATNFVFHQLEQG